MAILRRKLGVLNAQPKTKKYLQDNAAQFQIGIMPGVNFYAIKWNIPNMRLNVLEQSTPLVQRPVHGTKLKYGQLSVEFLVDQNLANYAEITAWLRGLAPPKDANEHRDWVRADKSATKVFEQHNSYSDGTLITLTTRENPNCELHFYDMFPTSLTDLNFDTTTRNAEELTATATFAFLYYDIIRQDIVK